jgi:DNA-directed RNA polymerase specialized sigma24 family protein
MSDFQEVDTVAGDGASGGEWLSLEDAAARLQVSERTVKRRLKAQEWPSRYEALPGGGRRRLLLLPPGGTSAGDKRDNGTGAKRDSVRDTEDTSPSASSSPIGTGDSASDTRGSDARDVRDTGASDTQGPSVEELVRERDTARAEVERLTAERDREREEVLFLRARNAELNAMVMQTARALPSQESAMATERPAIEATASTSVAAPGPIPAAPKAPLKPRPLWAVLLGIRPR